MNRLLLGAVGKSDGSAAELLLRWRQEFSLEKLLEGIHLHGKNHPCSGFFVASVFHFPVLDSLVWGFLNL
jgi:hypothetical protein